MYSTKHIVDIVTDGAGNGSGFTPPVNGRILSIIYQKDGVTPFANGVAVNVSLEDTGEPVWVESAVNASAIRAPRQITHGTNGAASLYAAGGTNVTDYISSAGDRVKITVSAAGAGTKGRFIVIVG